MDHKTKIQQALQGFYHEIIPDEVPDKLPLLDEFMSRLCVDTGLLKDTEKNWLVLLSSQTAIPMIS